MFERGMRHVFQLDDAMEEEFVGFVMATVTAEWRKLPRAMRPALAVYRREWLVALDERPEEAAATLVVLKAEFADADADADSEADE